MANFFKTDKKYGLIVKKDQKSISLAKNIFMDDSDDNGEDDISDKKKLSMKKQAGVKSMFLKKQVQLDIEKALTEDPNCFDYDEMYEKDHAKVKEEKVNVKVDVKPKYIAGLIKAAENRKKLTEIITEKKVQKEREAEGDMYADTESFVTNAYKEKLKQRKEDEEEMQRKKALEDYLESKGEKDYTAFYGHILNQKIGNAKPSTDDVPPKPETSDPKIKQERSSTSPHGGMGKSFQPKNKKSNSDDDDDDDVRPRKDEVRRRRSRSSTPRKSENKRNNSPRHKRRRDVDDDDDRRRRRRRSTSSSSRSPSHKRKRDGSRRDDKHRSTRGGDRRRSPDDRRTLEGKSENDKRRGRDVPERDVHEPEKAAEVRKEEPVQEELKEAKSKPVDKRAKKNAGESLEDARARYLARKAENSTKAKK